MGPSRPGIRALGIPRRPVGKGGGAFGQGRDKQAPARGAGSDWSLLGQAQAARHIGPAGLPCHSSRQPHLAGKGWAEAQRVDDVADIQPAGIRVQLQRGAAQRAGSAGREPRVWGRPHDR